MEQSDIIALIQETIWITIKLSLPIMLIGLAVGLVVALVQALTQIQEITLVFVPKILAIFVAIFLFLPAFSVTLITFMQQLADKIIGLP
ncbi:MAG: flagellar biosynthetic protein FliQ [Pseudobdellovibrionaceae bacterium]